MPRIENKIIVHLTRSEARAALTALDANREKLKLNFANNNPRGAIPTWHLPIDGAERAIGDAIKDHDHAALVAEAMANLKQLNKMAGEKSDATQVYVLLMSFCALGVLIGAVLMWWGLS